MLQAIQKQLSRLQAKRKKRLNKNDKLDTTTFDKEIRLLRIEIAAAKQCLKDYYNPTLGSRKSIPTGNTNRSY